MCNPIQNQNNSADDDVYMNALIHALSEQFPNSPHHEILQMARNVRMNTLRNRNNNVADDEIDTSEDDEYDTAVSQNQNSNTNTISEEEYQRLKKLDYESDKFIMNNVDLKDKETILKGNIQQGKTSSVINLALRILFEEKKHVFIVIDNYNTIRLSFLGRFKRLIDEIFTQNIRLSDYRTKPDTDDYLKDVANTDIQSLKSALKDKDTPRIFLCMANVKALKRLYKTHKSTARRRSVRSKFYLMIDESDLLSTTTIQGARADSARSKLIKELWTRSFGTARVSATPFSHFIVDCMDTKCKHVKYLPKNDDYVTWGDRHFKVKPFITDLYMTGKNPELFWNKDISDCYFSILNAAVNKGDKITCVTASIGNMVVHSKSVEKKTVEYFKDDPSVLLTVIRMYDGKIVVVPYHDKGSIEPSVKIDRKSESTLSLQENLYELQKKYSKDRNNHLILIVGNKQISRGQSLRSEVPNYTSYKDIIYCKTYIDALSDTLSLDEVLQSILRCGGIFKKQDRHFKGVCVYTSEKIIEAVNQVIKWEKQLDENIQDPRNADKNVREVVAAFIASKRPRNLTSKQTLYYTHKAFENMYFPTKEKLDFDLLGKNINNITVRPKRKKKKTSTNDLKDNLNEEQRMLLKEGTITRRIYDILEETNEWMTARDVHDYQTDWNTRGETFSNTVSTILYRFIQSDLAERKKGGVDNVYFYKSIKINEE